MDSLELCQAAALIAAAFVARKAAGTPEDAARTYFHCLDALVAVDEERHAKQRETEWRDRQPKPWATPKSG
jgi:hypothetical protein